jgi:hypothetical protein
MIENRKNKNEKNLVHCKQEIDTGWGWDRVILMAILLQSIGIRFIPFQGVIISLVLCTIMLSNLKITRLQGYFAFLIFIILMSLSFRDIDDYTRLIYLALILVTAFFYSCQVQTRWAQAEFDLLKITWLLSLHGLVSYLIYQFLPDLFSTSAYDTYQNKYFGIFYVAVGENDQIRATGICWEPGLFQYVANISLFLGIKYLWPYWKLAVSILAVIVSNSTTGYLVLILVAIYYTLQHGMFSRRLVKLAGAIAVLAVIFSYIFWDNIMDKLGGENTSGLIRMRDIEIGWELIFERPIFGHGLDFINNIYSNPNLTYISTKNFSNEFLTMFGIDGGGYTNGFLAFIVSYGILIGAFAYWSVFNTRLIQGGFKERLFFFLISIATLISEPISYTSWFYVLVISGIGARKRFSQDDIDRR